MRLMLAYICSTIPKLVPWRPVPAHCHRRTVLTSFTLMAFSADIVEDFPSLPAILEECGLIPTVVIIDPYDGRKSFTG